MGRKLANATFYVVKRIGKTVNDHKMIRANERVGVALSGGYASKMLLQGLVLRRKRIPIDYQIVALHVPDGGYGDPRRTEVELRQLCESLNVPFHCLDVADGNVRFQPIPYQSVMLKAGSELSLDAIALGHDAEDIGLQVLVSMGVGGKLHRMPLCDTGLNTRIRLIRPLAYLTSEHVLEMAKAEGVLPQPLQVARPHESYRAVCRDFLQSRRGPYLEQLRNLTISGETIRDEYLV